jgi:hypothetical protein
MADSRAFPAIALQHFLYRDAIWRSWLAGNSTEISFVGQKRIIRAALPKI